MEIVDIDETNGTVTIVGRTPEGERRNGTLETFSMLYFAADFRRVVEGEET